MGGDDDRGPPLAREASEKVGDEEIPLG